jgi:hypothetical protein
MRKIKRPKIQTLITPQKTKDLAAYAYYQTTVNWGALERWEVSISISSTHRGTLDKSWKRPEGRHCDYTKGTYP